MLTCDCDHCDVARMAPRGPPLPHRPRCSCPPTLYPLADALARCGAFALQYLSTSLIAMHQYVMHSEQCLAYLKVMLGHHCPASLPKVLALVSRPDAGYRNIFGNVQIVHMAARKKHLRLPCWPAPRRWPAPPSVPVRMSHSSACLGLGLALQP